MRGLMLPTACDSAEGWGMFSVRNGGGGRHLVEVCDDFVFLELILLPKASFFITVIKVHLLKT